MEIYARRFTRHSGEPFAWLDNRTIDLLMADGKCLAVQIAPPNLRGNLRIEQLTVSAAAGGGTPIPLQNATWAGVLDDRATVEPAIYDFQTA